MSDNLDAILSGLDDAVEKPKAKSSTAPRKPRKRTAPSTAPKPAPAKVSGTSEQRGKRKDPEKTQINANISADLKASLFYYLKAEGTTLQDVVEELLSDWVERQGGIIAPTKKKR